MPLFVQLLNFHFRLDLSNFLCRSSITVRFGDFGADAKGLAEHRTKVELINLDCLILSAILMNDGFAIGQIIPRSYTFD